MINRITLPAIAPLRHLLTLSLLAFLSSLVSVAPLHAGVLFTFDQVGDDVVATTSGTIAAGWSNPGDDTSGFSRNRTFLSASSVRAEFPGGVRFNQSSGNGVWSNNNPMSILGSTVQGVAVGDTFGFFEDWLFYAPAGTNAGDEITPITTITWAGKTFASFGLDTALSTTPLVLFTLDNSETISAVRTEPVPEPTSIAFLATGGLAAGVLAAARRRHRRGAGS